MAWTWFSTGLSAVLWNFHFHMTVFVNFDPVNKDSKTCSVQRLCFGKHGLSLSIVLTAVFSQRNVSEWMRFRKHSMLGVRRCGKMGPQTFLATFCYCATGWSWWCKLNLNEELSNIRYPLNPAGFIEAFKDPCFLYFGISVILIFVSLCTCLTKLIKYHSGVYTLTSGFTHNSKFLSVDCKHHTQTSCNIFCPRSALNCCWPNGPVISDHEHT